MASIGERIRSALGVGAGVEVARNATIVPAPMAKPVTMRGASVAPFASTFGLFGYEDRRQASSVLRRFADTNEWVRVAINRRKRQISQARWTIVRIDNPQKPADPRIVRLLSDLFRTINKKRESLRSLLDQVLEDLLILDAGTIELERTLGGQIVALHAVDGATIRPDRHWTGEIRNAPRYHQEIDGRIVGSFTNEQLCYMMANPRTTSAVGYSPVEWLVRIIEAELYGETYDFDMLKQTAPAGIFDLGAGIDPADVEAFQERYEAEIAGTKKIAFFGGGEDSGRKSQFVKFQNTAAEMQRQEYKKWLATKIAAVFEMDLGVFNLTAEIHRSIGEKQQSLTDDGHRAYGRLVEEFFTREIVWAFDASHEHAFQLADLNARDAAAQASLDEAAIRDGYTTPNRIIARDGLGDPIPGGDLFYLPGKGPYTGASTLGSKPDDEGALPVDGKPPAIVTDDPAQPSIPSKVPTDSTPA